MKIGKILSRFLKITVCFVLILSLTGCLPVILQSMYEDEVYAFQPNKFKNTKWVCNELDMYFYITDFGSGWVWGEYTVDGQKYRFDGSINENELNLNSSPTAQIDICDSRFVDKNGNTYLHIDDGYWDYYTGEYVDFNILYKDGILECNVSSSSDSFWNEVDAEIFTFEMEDKFAHKPQTTWKNQELNMNFGLYENGAYLIGEIVIKDKKFPFQAFQVCDGIYEFRIVKYEDNENYIYDHRYSYTATLPLVVMRLEKQGNQLVAKITDDHLFNAYDYPYWNFANSEYIFQRT